VGHGRLGLTRCLGEPLPRGTGDGVISVAFSPDGGTLAAGHFGDVVHLWAIR
jgi:hypothetical protein